MSDTSQVTRLRQLLRLGGDGDPNALDELLRHCRGRLEALTRRMLRGYPRVRRWTDTDDVVQNALLRLVRAMAEVKPSSPRAFFGLASLQIRRELIDLARHHAGPQAHAANHATGGGSDNIGLADTADLTHEPCDLAQWRETHEQIDGLPEPLREVVELLFYQGLSQADAADMLGVSTRTVQRRWHDALWELHQRLER